MARNFRLIVHQNSENLHVRLEGDFDGDSACELLEALERGCRFSSRAFIHTNGLSEVDPQGLFVFHTHLRTLKQDGRCWPLFFTGDHAIELAPEENGSENMSTLFMRSFG